MPRAIEFQVPCDTSLFTPLQLQPQALLRLTMSGWARFIRAHLCSFRALLTEHHAGVVVAGIRIDYARPLGFFDCDVLHVTAAVRSRKDGAMLDLDVDVRGAEQPAAQVHLDLVCLHVPDGVALSARPAPLPAALRDRFAADERAPGAPPRQVPSMIEGLGPPLCLGRTSFRVHRPLCEVADQWSFIEVPALAAAGRESLALQRAAELPTLRRGLSRPLRVLAAELRRPYFAFDDGVVLTSAHARGDDLTFVHTLRAQRGEDVHGTIVETF